MYSLARSTMRLNSSGVVFERGATWSGPASSCAAALSSGRSSASTTADSRSTARASAALAFTPACGRTGVTMVIVSSTASKAITRVGRTRTASGIPIGSGPGAGNESSISRTTS